MRPAGIDRAQLLLPMFLTQIKQLRPVLLPSGRKVSPDRYRTKGNKLVLRRNPKLAMYCPKSPFSIAFCLVTTCTDILLVESVITS